MTNEKQDKRVSSDGKKLREAYPCYCDNDVLYKDEQCNNCIDRWEDYANTPVSYNF